MKHLLALEVGGFFLHKTTSCTRILLIIWLAQVTHILRLAFGYVKSSPTSSRLPILKFSSYNDMIRVRQIH